MSQKKLCFTHGKTASSEDTIRDMVRETSMVIKLHKNATTTPAIRKAIQTSNLSERIFTV